MYQYILSEIDSDGQPTTEVYTSDELYDLEENYSFVLRTFVQRRQPEDLWKEYGNLREKYREGQANIQVWNIEQLQHIKTQHNDELWFQELQGNG